MTTQAKSVWPGTFFILIAVGVELLFPAALGKVTFAQTQTPVNANATNLLITNITANTAAYSGNKVPKYAKLEITFQVKNSVAKNFQLPYDSNPPHGIDPTYPNHQGISVDALFLPPGQTNWSNSYQQPAFYYQGFEEQIKKNRDNLDREWNYPTGEFAWKVRFAPNVPGTWQFKLKAQDASGFTETAAQNFTVANSSNPGFIKVSAADSRYFEFDDGTPFYGLGFAYGPNGPPLGNSTLNYEPDFQVFQQNHINLLRVWISSIYGVAWNRYLGGRNLYDGYLPRSALLPFSNGNRTTMTMFLDYEPEGDTGWFDACRFEFWDDPEAVKQNTNYRLRIKYRGLAIAGPRNIAYPNYGLVGKLGDWNPNCYEPDTGTVVTNYGLNNSDWQYLEGVWNSGSNNFLPRLYLGLENVTVGAAYVDSISIQEDLGNGQYGPEIMIEPSMEYELYFPQKESHALDKLVELAEKHSIYLKLVLMDKGDNLYGKIQDNGDFVTSGPDNTDGFYGVGRTVNKTRWLQQAWWRYLQARWGYSAHIHSWELTNEGDPFNSNHYALTDELGKYMHCRAFNVPVGSGDGAKCAFDHPNDHLVTTSFWHSFPGEQFWGNPNFPNVDYADLHAYISTGWKNDPLYESDTAKFHLDYSADVRSNIDWYTTQNDTPTKPVIRGETGVDFLNQQEEQPDLALDTQGIWLHNFLWSTLDAGAMSELYWWKENIKNQPGPDGQPGLHEIYGNFYNFIGPIALNNGSYQDATATVSNPNLRVVGQKDLTHHKGHLWIQNTQHTWRSVVDGLVISPISGTITLPGFQAGQAYTVAWWNTYETNLGLETPTTETIIAQPNGGIILTVSNLVNDTAVKINVIIPIFLPILLKEN